MLKHIPHASGVDLVLQYLNTTVIPVLRDHYHERLRVPVSSAEGHTFQYN